MGASPPAGDGVKVVIKADLKEEEKASFAVSWKPPDSLSGWTSKVLVGGKEASSLDLTGSLPSRELTLVVTPPGTYAPSDKAAVDGGKIVIAGKLGGVDVAREYAVSIDVIPGPPPWYKNPLLIAAAAVAVILLAVLVFFLRMPRFVSQNLILEDNSPMGKPPFFFVDNTYGCGRRKSIGTDELENAAKFFVKGRGSGAKCFVKALAGTEIKINGRKISGSFMLSDGNMIDIARTGQPALTYRYYERASAPVDLGDDEFVIMEYDDEDEFVVGEDEVLVEIPEEIAKALEEAQAAEAAPEAGNRAEAAATQDQPAAETGYGVDLASSPTATPDRFAGGIDDDATILGPRMTAPGPDEGGIDVEAGAGPEPSGEIEIEEETEPGPAPAPADEKKADDVPPVGESDFGDFFDDERTSHSFDAEEAEEDVTQRVDESKDKTKHATMFDDGITIMGFDGKSVTEMFDAEKKKKLEDMERKAKDQDRKNGDGKKA